jgi:hypothetical protein
MKIMLGVAVLLLTLFFAFAYFHSRSIDRAWLVNSASALLGARKQLHQHGAITNFERDIRVFTFTNLVTVDGTEFVCELAADVPGLTNAGSLVMTTDGTVIWIDKKTGPSIVRGKERGIVMPKRFRDY